MFDFFLNLVKKRHEQMEVDSKRDRKMKKLKNFLKMLGIALIVLVIEKLSELVTHIISESASMGIERVNKMTGQDNSDCHCVCNSTSMEQ